MNFDLKTVAEELNQMVSDGIVSDYAIGGAIAANVYMEVATTNDVDVFVIFKPTEGSLIIDPTPVISYFTAKGYVLNPEGYIIIGGWPVQFLEPPSPLEEEAFNSAVSVEDEDLKIRIFSKEYLAAIALKTNRSKDKSRLIAMRENRILDFSILDKILLKHGLSELWTKHEELFPLEEP